jgi:hypothetical protein
VTNEKTTSLYETFQENNKKKKFYATVLAKSMWQSKIPIDSRFELQGHIE